MKERERKRKNEQERGDSVFVCVFERVRERELAWEKQYERGSFYLYP